MKIRQGFVSNSSSASYYVTLKGDSKELLELIGNECDWPFLNIEYIVDTINERIKSIKDSLQYIEVNTESWLVQSKDSLEQDLAELEAKKKTMLEIQKIRSKKETWNVRQSEIINMGLDMEGIKVTSSSTNHIELQANTMMHNNYVEGMPELLKEIVLYFSFNIPDAIHLRVDHRG